MGPIFINDDGEFITESVKQFGRIKDLHPHGREAHCPYVHLSHANVQDRIFSELFRIRAGL